MDEGFGEVNQRFDAVAARIDALSRAVLILAASMFAAMLGLIATQL